MDVGAIFGPIVSGWLADAYGYGVAFAAAGAVVVLAGIQWVFAEETMPARQKDNA